jgi:arylsulfatase A-like enzyme
MRGVHRRFALLLLAVACAAGVVGCGDKDPAPPPATGYAPDGSRLGGGEPPERPPNLVLVLIDTLRADMLGDGDGSGRMPFLASLAARGTRFTQATAPAPWTLPSMASLLTGHLPAEHGYVDNDEGSLRVAPTFASILREGYGYRTAAFVGGPWPREKDLWRGFDEVHPRFALQGTETMVGPWADRRAKDGQRPFFLLLHTYEAHDPYGEENHPFPIPAPGSSLAGGENPLADLPGDAPAAEMMRRFLLDWRARDALLSSRYIDAYRRKVVPYRVGGYGEDGRPELGRELRAAYEEGVTWVDGLLAETFAFLERRGLLENTVVVVTSDHGEAFGEHGTLVHGNQLYDELVRIPWVMTGHEAVNGGRRVDGVVGLVDVMPTFLEIAGLDPLPGIEGRSALGQIRGDVPARPVLSQERLLGPRGEREGLIRAARTSRWKYMVTYRTQEGTVIEEAYDLEADPEERSDLARGGRIVEPAFDADFCTAVERARDDIWRRVDEVNWQVHGGYFSGAAQVTGDRPPPCGAAPGR